mmetsp:Transcript_19084/g.39481  ORF Transcript_19084/g.39481 Transcript_19084/m.39481 type:complete len:294 (+) Transcript_19084:193-1074(+)
MTLLLRPNSSHPNCHPVHSWGGQTLLESQTPVAPDHPIQFCCCFLQPLSPVTPQFDENSSWRKLKAYCHEEWVAWLELPVLHLLRLERGPTDGLVARGPIGFHLNFACVRTFEKDSSIAVDNLDRSASPPAIILPVWLEERHGLVAGAKTPVPRPAISVFHFLNPVSEIPMIGGLHWPYQKPPSRATRLRCWPAHRCPHLPFLHHPRRFPIDLHRRPAQILHEGLDLLVQKQRVGTSWDAHGVGARMDPSCWCHRHCKKNPIPCWYGNRTPHMSISEEQRIQSFLREVPRRPW